MQAVRFHEHGGLEVLKYEAAPDPEIAEKSNHTAVSYIV